MVYSPQGDTTPTPSVKTSDMDSRMPNVEDISKLIKTFRAGSGPSKSKFLFLHRKAYKDRSFENTAFQDNVIDLWENNLYGKVNFEGSPVILHEYNLKQFKSAREGTTIFGVNFVVDGFEEFRKYILKKRAYVSDGSLDPSDITLLKPVVKKGWDSPRRAYEKYFTIIYNAFLTSYLNANKKRKIRDFKSFNKFFISFVEIISTQYPITFSGFMKSRFSSCNVSGLKVEVFDSAYSEDLPKQENFLKNINFPFYMQSAENFGFLIDKNSPWRLVANIGSPAMKKRMSKKGVPYTQSVESELFFTMFEGVSKYDIDFLRANLASMYNSFVQANKFIAVPYLSSIGCTSEETSEFQIVKTNYHELKPINAFTSGKMDVNSNYYKQYNNYFWLRLYYFIRSAEEGNIIDLERLDRSLPRVYSVLRRLGISSAVEEVNKMVQTR